MEANENIVREQQYLRARKRVRAIAGFYKHAAIYLIVNAFLIALKYFQLDPGEEFLRFSTFATAFFWGIGLAFHAFGVFTDNVIFGKNWEDRKIDELMEKERKRNQRNDRNYN